MAPPCGTASLARQIPIPGEDFAPRPLRSLLEPDGLSDLTQNEMLRVGQANLLYQFVADTIDLCNELGKWCMVENPANSLFWLVTPMMESLAVKNLFIQDHQACAYGSSRPKMDKISCKFFASAYY